MTNPNSFLSPLGCWLCCCSFCCLLCYGWCCQGIFHCCIHWSCILRSPLIQLLYRSLCQAQLLFQFVAYMAVAQLARYHLAQRQQWQ